MVPADGDYRVVHGAGLHQCGLLRREGTTKSGACAFYPDEAVEEARVLGALP